MYLTQNSYDFCIAYSLNLSISLEQTGEWAFLHMSPDNTGIHLLVRMLPTSLCCHWTCCVCVHVWSSIKDQIATLISKPLTVLQAGAGWGPGNEAAKLLHQVSKPLTVLQAGAGWGPGNEATK